MAFAFAWRMALSPLGASPKYVRPRSFGYKVQVAAEPLANWGRMLVGAALGGFVGLILWSTLLALPFRWASSSSVSFNLAGALFVLAVVGGGLRGLAHGPTR